MKRSSRRLAVLLALFAAFAALVASGLFPQWPLRRFAERRLRSSTGPASRIGGLRVVPGKLLVEISDLHSEGAAYELDVPRARLAFAPASSGGSLALRFVEVDAPRLTLRATKGPAPRLVLPRLHVELLTLTRGSVLYRDEALGGDLALDGLELRGSLGSGTLQLAVARAVLRRERPLSFGRVQGSLRVSPLLDVVVDAFETRVGEASQLKASGRLGGPAALTPDLKLEARLQLSDLARLGDWGRAEGTLAGEGRVVEAGGAIRFEGQLAGDGLVVLGWPAQSATLRALYQEGRVSGSLALSALGGQARAEAALEGSRLTGRAHLSGIDARELAERLGSDSGVPGVLSGEIEWNGDTARDVRLTAKAELVSRAEGASAQSRAQASGLLRARDRTLHLSWSASIEGQAGAVESARFAGQGTARGSLPAAVVIEGTLEGRVVPKAAGTRAAIDLTGSIRSKGAAVALELAGKGLDGSMSAAADVRGAVLRRLVLRGESLDLHALLPDARGRASFDFEGSGDVSRLSGGGKARVDALIWQDVKLGPVSATLSADRGDATLGAEAPELRMKGEGQLPASGPRVFKGKLSFDETPLAAFASLLPEGRKLEGQASLTADFAVPLDRPAGLDVRALVQKLDARTEEIALHATQPFHVSYRSGRVAVDGLKATGPGLDLSASGGFGTERGSALEARAALALELAHLPLPGGVSARGRVQADVSLGGTLGRPQASGDVRLEGVELLTARYPKIVVADARVQLEGDAAVLRALTASVAGGSVEASGRIPFAAVIPAARARPTTVSSQERARLALRWQGIEAARIVERLRPEGPSPVSASLSGQAQIEGGLASLLEVKASVELPATKLRVQDLDLDVSPVALRFEQGTLAPAEVTVTSDAGTFRLHGGGDLAGRTLDLAASGRIELRALSPLLSDASLSGVAEVDVTLKGTLDDPRSEGMLQLRDATLRLRDLPQALTELQGRVAFDGTTLRLQDASGRFGGGAVTMTGTAALKSGGLADVRVGIEGRDIALRYPGGMRSRLDADLSLSGRAGALLLSGAVRAQRGLYDLDIAFEETLRAPVVKPSPSPFLRSIALDIRVETVNPVLVRNNLARLEATGSLTARGDLETITPFGRLEIEPGGKLFLQGRELSVSSGTLVYNGTWNPEVSVTAETIIPKVSYTDYKVSVSASGSLDRPQLSFSSDPSLSEGQIVTLIATGRAGSAELASGAWVAGEQAAVMLTSRLTRGVAGGLRQLGFDEVTIQPELLARETDPGARFTFGKHLTRDVNLVYSLSLNDPEQRFIQLEARPGLDIVVTLQRRDDGSFTYGAGQKLRWGAAHARQSTLAEDKLRLREVRIEGDHPIDEAAMRRAIRAHAGAKASTWDLQDDTNRLRRRLIDEGYLEAEVGARLERDVATLRVRAGSKYRWRVEGMSPPSRLEREIKAGLYEEEALDKGRQLLLRELQRSGHLRAKVEAKAVAEEGGRTLLFRAEPGPRLHNALVRFPGARAISEASLLKAAGGAGALLASPEEAVKRIEAAYRDRYYLAVRVERPRVSDAGDAVRIEVTVAEGPPARVAEVRFEGASLPIESLGSIAGIMRGEALDPDAVAEAGERLRTHYLDLGYPAARLALDLVPAGADVEIVFRVSEGERSTVGTIAISGLERTRGSLVRRHIPLEVGDPVDPRKLASVERRLLALGLFSRVVVTASGNPADVVVDVVEDARFITGYDLRYNSDEKGSGLVEAEMRNLFGTGLGLGARYRRGADVRESRGALHVPNPFGPLGDVTASVFRLEEDLPGSGGTVNTRVQHGGQLQQRLPFGNRWNVLYGYSFKRVSLTEFTPISVAGLDLSVVRDTRDNVLDTRRGQFFSVNLDISPKAVGSDFNFVKGYAQAFLTRSLNKRLVWAQGYRLGLAYVFGGEPLPSSERFRAGGGNSLRGFATESVGPRSFLGDPLGGQAVAILNQELRYQPSRIGGAVFYDAGNVFSASKDLGFDLRHSLGFGLRWQSPIGLLRLDLAFPLGRRPGERSYRYFFSLGQAF